MTFGSIMGVLLTLGSQRGPTALPPPRALAEESRFAAPFSPAIEAHYAGAVAGNEIAAARTTATANARREVERLAPERAGASEFAEARRLREALRYHPGAPVDLLLDDLLPRAVDQGQHLMECSGNTRSASFGLLSSADWTGIRLLDAIDRFETPAGKTRLLVSGFGAILAFELDPALDCFEFLNRLRNVVLSSNLGDNRTLAIPVAHTIYWEMGPERRASMGIADSLIRVSVGIEEPEDLIADFEQALS